MSHVLYRWGHWVARRPWVAIGLWLVLAVAVTGASVTVGHALDDTMASPGSDSQAATDLLSSVDSGAEGLTSYVVATPQAAGDTFFTSARARTDLAELERSLTGLPDLLGATDPAGMLASDRQAAVADQLVSPDGRVAMIRLQYPAIEQTDKSALTALKAALDDARPDSSLRIEAGGDLYFTFEAAPMSVYEAVGLVAALVILLVAFGSVIAAGLPLAIGLFGLLVGTSALSLVAYGVDIPVWAPVMASMVGLGAGIDYALFLVTRHREYLAAGLSVPESVGRALATAGQSVVFAGGTVVVAILGLAFAGLPFVAAGGVGISVVVLVMVLAAVTLLPALLGLAGHRITHRHLSRRTTGDPSTRRWTRWGTHVTRHPVAYLVGGTTLLLALAAPATALRLGMPDDGSYPQARTERRAYDLVGEGFGPGAISPMVIAIDTAGDGSTPDRVATAVADDPGIASARALPTAPGSDVAVVVAQATSTPQDENTQQTLERLRSSVLPSALADSPATAHVGGYTAVMTDMSNRVQERLPIFLTAVVLLSFLLLVVLFRSLVVPIKAAVLNLLSVGAAYGVLVMVFQWGWAKDLIGLEATVPIISFIPLFMFAILFGLSMDYEVFLLSRIREEYLRTGDNDHAVVHGIGVTARTISAGAAIMVAVFGGFVTGSDPTMKMLGLGLSTAVLVDATVVRLVLVPATMKLLGRLNWWLPAWLDRLLPSFDHDSPSPATSSPARPASPALPELVPALAVAMRE